ncbi:hypothetical protein SDC9_122020 [bioreactor metagenome]|uniref:Uncharacterized protein n=1 Tax=bioreactor metagenome TaxID=1076179 RepID=A0A645CDL6_9ZZZZ
MRRSDLHGACAEFHFAVFVPHDRNLSAHGGHDDGLADQVLITRVFGIHRNAGVAKHRFRARGRNRDGIALVRRVIAHMPKVAVLLLILHLCVRKRGLAVRAPVDDAIPAIDQSLVVEAHKHLSDGLAAAFVHREAFTFPITGGAKVAQLFHNGRAVFVPPSPGAL